MFGRVLNMPLLPATEKFTIPTLQDTAQKTKSCIKDFFSKCDQTAGNFVQLNFSSTALMSRCVEDPFKAL